MARLVLFEPNLNNDMICLSEEESRHCIKILRHKKGDEICVTNGKGTLAVCTIIDDDYRNCLLKINSKTTIPKNRNYHLALFIAPVKHADRLEWLVEKATESGVDEIFFIETRHVEKHKVNLNRLLKLTVSAIKQSKQYWLPNFEYISDFKQAVYKAQNYSLKLIAKVGSGNCLKHYAEPKPNKIAVFIGPEGDFSDDELQFALQNDFKPLWLGHAVLRTETAALFVCMGIKALLETNFE